MQESLVQETLEMLCSIEEEWWRMGRVVWWVFPPHSSVKGAPLPIKVRHLVSKGLNPALHVIVDLPCPRSTQLVLYSSTFATETWIQSPGKERAIVLGLVVDAVRRGDTVNFRPVVRRMQRRLEKMLKEADPSLKEGLEQFRKWLKRWVETLSPAVWFPGKEVELAAYIGAATLSLEKGWEIPCPVFYIKKALELVQSQAANLSQVQAPPLKIGSKYLILRREGGAIVLRWGVRGQERNLGSIDSLAYALYRTLPAKEPRHLGNLLRKLLRWRDAIANKEVL